MDKEEGKDGCELCNSSLGQSADITRWKLSSTHLALQAQEVRMFNDLREDSVPFGCFDYQRVDLRRGRSQVAGAIDAGLEGATGRWPG